MKKYIYPITFSLVLAAFTLFVVLDTFLISRPIENVQGQINNSMFSSRSSDTTLTDNTGSSKATDTGADTDTSQQSDTASTESGSADSSDTADSSSSGQSSSAAASSLLTENATLIGEYQNDQASIKLYSYTYENTAVYAADITLSSSEYLKTAFASDYYGKNVTDKTSSIAQQNNAILAINGDYYGARESGYVIRNGIVYRDSNDGRDLLCVYADGTMKIVSSSEKTAQALVDEGVWQAFSFGPALVQNGEIDVSADAEVGKAMASNPRTAVGIIDTCHYVFVVSDGRTSESKGLSLYQLASFMQSIGVKTAYNLDGGGSSTLYFNGEIINCPTTSGRSMKERGVSDIVYIAK